MKTFVCFYCGKVLNPKKKTRDHKQPRSRNGSSAPQNIVAACKPCNQDKGSLTLQEYRVVVAFRQGLIKETKMPFPGEER